jgi:GTP cyclohydrolase II
MKRRKSAVRPSVKKRARPTMAVNLAQVEQAVDAMRSGEIVALAGTDSTVLTLAAEHASKTPLDALRRYGPPDLLLTHYRAATLKMRLYTPRVVAVPIGDMTAAELRSLADPTDDLGHPLRGPFAVKREVLPEAYPEAVELAKLAGLLPSVIAVRSRSWAKQRRAVPSRAVADYATNAAAQLKIVTTAHVPLAGAETAQVAAFRPSDGGPEHLAILIGDPRPPGPVLVRIHSECFTGDLLASLKCDCGDQLRGAIEAIAKSGSGVLLYLSQEGRGIGLMNKLRAYRLQDQGFDTMEANQRLGFADDERQFLAAAVMLKALGFDAVRLLTNNPEKAAALARHGIKVAERVPHSFPSNPHNAHYLATKRSKGGHHL